MTGKKRPTRKAKITVVDELPEPKTPGTSGPPAHWVEVAATVKATPGQWHEVRFADMSDKAHQSAASGINAATRNSDSKTGKNRAFLAPGYTAAYREGRLYVRYDAPKVRSIGKRAS